jgi:asparagine synthase (glutamine-hydrolysing)
MCGIFALLSNHPIDKQSCLEALESLEARGPDNYKIVESETYFLGFRRLAINDLTVTGNQPMVSGSDQFMCNGEIYNHLELQQEYGLTCESRSDCEVIMRADIDGCDMAEFTDSINGDFAYMIRDTKTKIITAARDRIGVRPLFFGLVDHQTLVIASEIKAMKMCTTIKHMLPGYLYQFCQVGPNRGWYFTCNRYTGEAGHPIGYDRLQPEKRLRKLLLDAISIRTESERPFGCLLSGGLDSTIVTYLLVQALGARNVRTYSIGMKGSIDLEYARKVADFLHTQHTEVVFTPEEGLAVIPDVIKAIETYDITTVRASIGMWLLGRYIATNTTDKVIFSGELSDELMCGYLYFHHAPSDKDAEDESRRLVENVYRYDALRADRCISSHGLELRVPFADKHVVNYCLSLPGSIKRPQEGVEKRHLREQFVGDIPDDILWRRKDGFSDGVSSMEKPWYEHIKEFVEDKVDEVTTAPSKEAQYYENIYNSLYGNFQPIEEYWMPKWVKVDTANPSGRIIAV